MVLRNPTPSYPRRGPSCLFMLVFFVLASAGIYVIMNAEEVREAIIPTVTPLPTRSAVQEGARAELYKRDNAYDEAIASYERAIELDVDEVQYYLPLIELLIQTRQPARALEWAERVQLIATDDENVWTVVASAYLANGNRLYETGDPVGGDLEYQKAIDASNNALTINGNNANAYAYKAGALTKLGAQNYETALQLADTAVTLAPTNVNAHYYKAQVLELMGRYENAADEYLQTIELDGSWVEPRINMAYMLFFSDRRQEAILALQEAIELDEQSAEAYDALGYFYFVAGEYPRAEDNAYKAVELDPDMVRAQAHLGAAYYKGLNYELAIQHLEVAIEKYANVNAANASYFNMLGYSYYFFDEANCSKAIAIFQQVIDANPGEISVANAEDGLELCRQAQF